MLLTALCKWRAKLRAKSRARPGKSATPKKYQPSAPRLGDGVDGQPALSLTAPALSLISRQAGSPLSHHITTNIHPD